MRSQVPPAGVAGNTLTPALLEQYWPVAQERLVNALGARGVEGVVAEEAVAEAATRALGRGLVVTDLDDFCRWAFVVARNVAHDSTRRSRRMALLEEVPDRTSDYDLVEHVEARLRWRKTVDAIDRLSEMDRATLFDELEAAPQGTRREAVRQAVRRHRARARLRQLLGQLGGWLGWLRRPTWPWPSLPSASLEGLAALVLLPLLSGSAVGAVGPGVDSTMPLPTAPAATGGATATALPVPVVERPVPAPVLSKTIDTPHADAPVDESLAQGWPFQFTPSPSYEEDHTVFATGGETCGDFFGCSLVYMSRDGGASWRLLPSRGRSREGGRLLLPPSYPRDPRIFWASQSELSVSTDDGETFRPVTATTGPAVMSPLFSAGDPRILFGSDRQVRSPLPMQYREGDTGLRPFQLPLPPTAAAMELWFGGSYGDDGRMFVGVLEAPGLPTLAAPRVAYTVPALYTCGPRSCERVIDFGMNILPPRLASSPVDPRIVFVSTTNSLHRSTDGGASFREIDAPRRGFLSSLVVAPDGRLYVKIGTQLFASDDAGETWTLLRNEPVAFANLAVLPDGTLIEGRPSASGDGVRCSGDRGRTWSPCAA